MGKVLFKTLNPYNASIIADNLDYFQTHYDNSTELNDKFDTCISDINSIFTEKLDRINNDLNNISKF